MGGNAPGFFGALHTWGRQMQYHPHIHYVVPGGTLSKSEEKWYPSSSGFYMNVRALSMIFRAKFRDAMKAAGLFDQIPSDVWQIDWNVNCKLPVTVVLFKNTWRHMFSKSLCPIVALFA